MPETFAVLSDTNAQPWHFTVVTNAASIAALHQATLDRFATMATDLLAAGQKEAARKLRVFERYAAHFGGAPALIVISGEPYDSRFVSQVFAHVLTAAELARLTQEESIKSTSLAAMNLLLAAHALGYGAVPMTGPVLVIPEQLQRLLALPPGFAPHLVVALGRPAGPVTAGPPRKDWTEVCTWVD